MKLTRTQEEQLWRDLYMMMDDNETHCDNAYISNDISNVSDDKLHEQNIESITQFITICHMTMDEITEHCPLAKNFDYEHEVERSILLNELQSI